MEKKLSYEDGRELFVKKLCKLMNEKKLSCQYLSSKIKKNDGYINRIINGKKDPNVEMLKKNISLVLQRIKKGGEKKN